MDMVDLQCFLTLNPSLTTALSISVHHESSLLTSDAAQHLANDSSRVDNINEMLFTVPLVVLAASDLLA